MQIKILAEGGKMAPGPALSQKLGPAGINITQVIQKVNEATKNFEGLKVPVELDVNTSTREFSVKVFSPPVSELLKRELKIEKGSGNQKNNLVANASIEQIISVAKTKFQNMLCKDLKSAVKSVVGTCGSLGILIESKPAVEIESEIFAGKYDKEINSEKTITPTEKKKELDEFFSKVQKEQEQKAQLAQKEKEATEAAKTAETAAAPVEGAASTTAVAAAKSNKKEEKKKK